LAIDGHAGLPENRRSVYVDVFNAGHLELPHRPLRDAQFLGRAGEALVTRRSLESLERVERAAAVDVA
jgi:hypothetical protein